MAVERAEVEYAHGLLAYDDGDYQAALAHLQTTVRLEPEHPHAHFYLGVTLSRLGATQEAIAAFEQALTLDATLRHVHYHLGLAYFQEARYPAALTQLTLAAAADPGQASTQLYLGYTQHLLGHSQEALPFLQEAMRLDASLTGLAQYAQGVALAALGRDAEARAAFQVTATTAPDATLARNARRYLDLLQIQRREQRAWQIQGDVSLQYDDNVILESNDQVVDFGRRADGRTVVTATARLFPVNTPRWRLGGEYALFDSRHFALHDFDVQSHTATVLARFNAAQTTWHLATSYAYTLLDAAPFSEDISVEPSVVWRQSQSLYAVAAARYRRSDFFRQDISAQQDPVRNRDGWSIRTGWDQHVRVPRLRSVLRLSYYFEGSRHRGSDWEFNGHEVGLGAQTSLGWEVTLTLDGHYRHRDYVHRNSFAAVPFGVLDRADRRRRHDDILTGSVMVSRPLGQYVTVSAGVMHISNLSNLVFFAYDRTIVMLTLTGRY